MKKIITLDIETAPAQSYHWRFWNENIGIGQNIRPTYMLSYVLKVNNGKCVYRKHDDPDFLTVLYDTLEQADAIVTYNGDKFDMPHVHRELVEAGYTPLRPVPSIDLIKTVKKRFKFASNRLDYVCSVLLGERKLDTGGFDLWPAFMNGDPKALKLMRRYNIKDVNLTWKLYKYLRPWIINHPYLGGFAEIGDDEIHYECPVCNFHQFPDNHQRRTRCFAIRQIRCDDCGHWYDGKRKKL